MSYIDEFQQILKNLPQEQKSLLKQIMAIIGESYKEQLIRQPSLINPLLNKIHPGDAQNQQMVEGTLKAVMQQNRNQQNFNPSDGDANAADNDFLEAGVRRNSSVTNDYLNRTKVIQNQVNTLDQNTNLNNPFAIPKPGQTPKLKPPGT